MSRITLSVEPFFVFVTKQQQRTENNHEIMKIESNNIRIINTISVELKNDLNSLFDSF